MKLTDPQLVLLSRASQRPDQCAEIPPTLKGGAAQKLAVTARGLAAVGIDQAGALPKGRPSSGVNEKRSAPTLGRPSKSAAAPHKTTATRPAPIRRKASKDEIRQPSAKVSPRRSKQSHVIEMLQQKEGTTVAAIIKATNWQPHSVRGFLAAVVRNKLGLTLTSEKTGTERVYRIVVKNISRKSKSRRKAA